MAPIVSPKLLSQILMYGCAVEVCSAKYVKIAAVESRAQLIAVPDFIFGSVAPRQRRLLGPKLNKASYASLPNSNFVIDAEEVDLEMGVCEAPAAILQKSSSSLDLAPVNDETAPLVQEELACSSEAGTERGSLSTSVSTASSTLNSAPTSCDPPSTAASSIPPWVQECFQDPAEKFGVPPSSRYVRSRPPPVDSLRLARQRRASEAPNPSPFISRPRKISDARGLKDFGLRGLQFLKKVNLKW